MCAACEMYEINLLRQRIAARRREQMRAEAVETEGEDLAAAARPNTPADEQPSPRSERVTAPDQTTRGPAGRADGVTA